MLIGIGAAAVAAVLFVIFFLSTYKVISPNEAHIIVFMGRGRKIKSPVQKDGVDGRTSYFFIPFLMKRFVMPLTNVKLDINDIPLNDNQVAPFVCDVNTWLHVADPVKAAERLDFNGGDVFGSLHKDLAAIVQAIARAAAMKQEILDIMRDRATFSNKVSEEVNVMLKEWGVELVGLEINDIRDQEGSQVIHNYEAMRKASVQSLARIQVAERNREAVESEQQNRQKEEVAKAESEKNFTEKQIEKDAVIGIRTQEKEQQIAVAAQETNKQKVQALRVSTVGQAEVTREAQITTAQGEGEAIRIKGEKEADVITLTGNADANAIKAKGLAEAAAKDAMAEALKKFNDAGIDITKITAAVDIQKAFAQAVSKIAEKAEFKILTNSDSSTLFGLPINAGLGANLGQLIEGLGKDKVQEIINEVKA